MGVMSVVKLVCSFHWIIWLLCIAYLVTLELFLNTFAYITKRIMLVTNLARVICWINLVFAIFGSVVMKMRAINPAIGVICLLISLLVNVGMGFVGLREAEMILTSQDYQKSDSYFFKLFENDFREHGHTADLFAYTERDGECCGIYSFLDYIYLKKKENMTSINLGDVLEYTCCINNELPTWSPNFTTHDRSKKLECAKLLTDNEQPEITVKEMAYQVYNACLYNWTTAYRPNITFEDFSKNYVDIYNVTFRPVEDILNQTNCGCLFRLVYGTYNLLSSHMLFFLLIIFLGTLNFFCFCDVWKLICKSQVIGPHSIHIQPEDRKDLGLFVEPKGFKRVKRKQKGPPALTRHQIEQLRLKKMRRRQGGAGLNHLILL